MSTYSKYFHGEIPELSLSQNTPLKVSQALGLLQICMCDTFQEFYSAFSESQKSFKTLELKMDVPEETFITEIIDDRETVIRTRGPRATARSPE